MRTNEPIRNEEIMAVFKESSFTKHHNKESTSKDVPGKFPERSGKDSSKGEKQSSKKGKDSGKKKKTGDSSKTLQSESEHAGMASKLLLMYYVLLYQETYIANIKILGKSSRCLILFRMKKWGFLKPSGKMNRCGVFLDVYTLSPSYFI